MWVSGLACVMVCCRKVNECWRVMNDSWEDLCLNNNKCQLLEVTLLYINLSSRDRGGSVHHGELCSLPALLLLSGYVKQSRHTLPVSQCKILIYSGELTVTLKDIYTIIFLHQSFERQQFLSHMVCFHLSSERRSVKSVIVSRSFFKQVLVPTCSISSSDAQGDVKAACVDSAAMFSPPAAVAAPLVRSVRCRTHADTDWPPLPSQMSLLKTLSAPCVISPLRPFNPLTLRVIVSSLPPSSVRKDKLSAVSGRRGHQGDWAWDPHLHKLAGWRGT